MLGWALACPTHLSRPQLLPAPRTSPLTASMNHWRLGKKRNELLTKWHKSPLLLHVLPRGMGRRKLEKQQHLEAERATHKEELLRGAHNQRMTHKRGDNHVCS